MGSGGVKSDGDDVAIFVGRHTRAGGNMSASCSNQPTRAALGGEEGDSVVGTGPVASSLPVRRQGEGEVGRKGGGCDATSRRWGGYGSEQPDKFSKR